MLSKNELRKKILQERKNFKQEDYIEKEKIIMQNAKDLISSINHDKIKKIGMYCPNKGEPDILDLLNMQNWEISIPKLWGMKLEFVKYDEKFGFEKTEYKYLLQPKNNDIVYPDIALFPGVAFSLDGYRLGFGVGHYDRYFGRKDSSKIIKIAVCFHEELYEFLPIEPHDVPADYIITDKIIVDL